MSAKLHYSKSHEWVRLEGEIATVGISDFAVKELTDLVYLELPEIGSTFKSGQPFGVVESVKSASDLYAPVAGEVVAVNEPLPGDLALLSTDPYGKGWIAKFRVTPPVDLSHLMTEAEYRTKITSAG